jgi:hypothetical protein
MLQRSVCILINSFCHFDKAHTGVLKNGPRCNFAADDPKKNIFCEHSYLQYSSATRAANRTHARKSAVSGLEIPITIIILIP